MGYFGSAVLTDAGADLIAASIAEEFTIEFTKMLIGDGEYEESEKTKDALRKRGTLKFVRKEVGFSNITVAEQAVKLKAVITNENVTDGFRMTEIGITARKKGSTEEILFSVAVAEEADYLPDMSCPVSFTQEYYTKAGNAEKTTINVEMGEYALAEDMLKVNYPEYEEPDNLKELESGEGFFTAFGKIKKAVSSIMEHLNDTDSPHGIKKIAFSGSYEDLKNKPETGICKTPQGTTVKTIECPDFELRDGARVMVTFHNGNTCNYMKLNVNGTGEYFAYFPIDGFRAYNHELISKLIVAGCAYEFIFQDAETETNRKWVYCGVVGTPESIGIADNTVRTPENTGFATLREYLLHLINKSTRLRVFPVSGFSDLPQTDWGFTVEFSGMAGAVYVKAYKHLSADSFYTRTIGADNNWISDWSEFLNKAHLSNHLGGPGIPFIQSATDSGGLMEIGKYIDFHDAGSHADFDARLYYDRGKLVSTVPIQDGNGKVIADTYLSKSGGTVTGDVVQKSYTVHEDTGGLSLCNGDISYGFATIPNNISGFGGHKIYDGLICADNVDSGIIDYIALGGGNRAHYFWSLNSTGNSAGYAKIENGSVFAQNGFASNNGDYAEYWEYQDSNSGNEDRTGLFVTFAENKIRVAEKGDNLAKVGVVSATPSILGDSDGKEWTKKYQKDVYGRDIWEDVEQEDGTVVKDRVLNPAYDETQKYIKRADRPEWDAVGTHGKLVVRDDGTCQPDGFCVPTDGGIATAADDGFYVMERLDESHIRIYMR